MDQLKQEKEKILSYYFDENAPAESRITAYNLRQELSSSIQGVFWFLQNAPFNEATTYMSAFECFKFRLLYFPSEFNPEILNQLIIFLFQHSIEILPKLPPNVIYDLCKSQAYLTFLIFPELCPQLFDTIFQFPDILKYSYLNFFCECLILPNPQNVDRFNIIKRYFEQINFSEQIFLQISNGIEAKNPDALRALSAFTRWSKNIDYLMNIDFMNIILSDTSAELASATLKFFGSIVQRSIPDEVKKTLVESLQIAKHIEFYFQNYNQNFEIVQTCAETISILGYSSAAPLSDMFQLLMAFFNLPDEISEKVVSYLRIFTINNPLLCNDIALKVIDRIIIYFQNTPLTTYSNYLTQLLYVLGDCYTANRESFYNSFQILINDIKSADINLKLPNISALIAIMDLIFRAKITYNDILYSDFFNISKELFNVIPSNLIENKYYFFPVYGFLRSFIYNNQVSSKDFNQNVLNQLTIFSLDPNLPDVIRGNYQSLFLHYVQKKVKLCSFVSDKIEAYLGSRSKDLMAVSALCLLNLPRNNKINKSVGCLQYINNNLLGENLTLEGISLALAFLGSFEPITEELQQMEIEILTKIAPLCDGNDELYGSLCLTTKGLNEIGFQFFNNLLPNVKGVSSVAATADTAIHFLQVFQSVQNLEAIQCVVNIAINLIDIFIVITSQTLSMPLNTSNITQIRQMVRSCYCLFIKCYDSICQSPESLNKLLLFTKDLIVQKYNTPTILINIYQFLSCAAESNGRFIAEQFTGVSLYFLIASNFDPNKKEWSLVLQGLVELHRKLQEKAYQVFSDNLGSTFGSFGLAEFVQNYNLTLERDERQKMVKIKQIFTDAMTVRNSMPW